MVYCVYSLYLSQERLIITLRTAEGHGAHSQYQHHLLIPRHHSLSTWILQSGGHILYQGTHCTPYGWTEICNDVVCVHQPCLLLHLTYSVTDILHHKRPLFRAKRTPDRDISLPIRTQQQIFLNTTHIAISFTVSHVTVPALELLILSSSNFFFTKTLEELGKGRGAKGVLAFAIVSKFAVVALKDTSPGVDGDMMLYVSVDSKEWAKAQFPHASQARLRENAYTIVESTIHSRCRRT